MGIDYTYPLIDACLGRCPKTGVILGKLDFENEHGHRLATIHDVMIVYKKNEKGQVIGAFMTDGEWGISSGNDFDRLQPAAELHGSNYPGWQEYLEGEDEGNLVQAVRDLLSMEKPPKENDPSLLED